MQEDKVLLGHGSGGIMMKQLIDQVFVKAYPSEELLVGDDAAILQNLKVAEDEHIAFSTDSYVVTPQFFPGGDIGRLAVCGTVNDVSTSGARPVALSVGFIIEQGYQIDNIKKICMSMAKAAKEAGVKIVTGDTKVVESKKADGIYINTAGIGVVKNNCKLSGANAMPGDAVLISGSVADHGMAIMSCREGLSFSSDIKSDAAPLNGIIENVMQAAPDVRCFRDPTRGGIASTLNEFAEQSGVNIVIEEAAVPLKDDVKSACDTLGYDPFQVANEGKLVCIVPENQAQSALGAMQSSKYGKDAAIIGMVEHTEDNSPMVFVKTPFGSKRVLDMLVGEQLPRIC